MSSMSSCRLLRRPSPLRLNLRLARSCFHNFPLPRFGNADHTTSNKHAGSESDTHGKEGKAKVKCIQRAEAAGSHESANQANRGEEALDSGAHATCRRGSYQRIDGWLDKCVDGSMNRKERHH